MEVKSIKEEQREDRIKYEKNKGYKLCDNGYIIYNSNEHYFKLFGCSNKFIKCKLKMQVGFLTLIKLIIYFLLKIATIFSKKNIFLNYVVISASRKMIFVKNLKLII